MIAAFCGSHSTGKSTLLEYFRGREGYVCIDSVTRSSTSTEERRIDGIESLDEVQLKICNNIIVKMSEIVQMQKADSSKVYLLDRCAVDFMAYTKCFVDKKLVQPETYNKISELISPFLHAIDVIFYTPLEFDIVDDGVRSLDEELRRNVDDTILDLLLWNKVTTVRLKGSVRQRLEKIHAIVTPISVLKKYM